MGAHQLQRMEGADELSAITGMDRERCVAYLNAFGSLEAASNAFFDGRVPSQLGEDVRDWAFSLSFLFSSRSRKRRGRGGCARV